MEEHISWANTLTKLTAPLYAEQWPKEIIMRDSMGYFIMIFHTEKQLSKSLEEFLINLCYARYGAQIKE